MGYSNIRPKCELLGLKLVFCVFACLMCFVCGRTRPGGLLHRCIWGCGGRPGSSECANVWSAHNRSPSGSSLWNSPALPPCCLNTYKHTHTLLLLLILSPAYSCIYTFFFPTSLFSCSWLNFFNSNPKIPPGTFVPRYGYDVENTRLVFFCRKLRQNTQSQVRLTNGIENAVIFQNNPPWADSRSYVTSKQDEKETI